MRLLPARLLPSLATGLLLGLAALPQVPAPARAEAPAAARGAEVGELVRLLQVEALFEVISEEGHAYGADIEAAMFPGRGSLPWARELARIYDPRAMAADFAEALAQALGQDQATIAAAEAFFASEAGRRITGLEVEARRLMVGDDAREAAEVAAEKMTATRDPLLRRIRRLIETGDLVEQNVAGSLTGFFAFNEGMEAALPAALRRPAEDLMAQVRAQEGQSRVDTTNWLVAYMALAYAPLAETELDALIDFTGSEAGQALNAALFQAFDAVLTPRLRALGFAAGQTMTAMDI
ncbi:hypothetical protein [Pseudogemmobacter sonorensis]|uniref:hypothetical protein n=1 Tax=Pseudogemmobacter sonorensis TaxID=2989681 RepID=UPI0036C75DB1